MAQCMKAHSSASFYSVLALMNGLYSFDPVGLFVTGRKIFIYINYLIRWIEKIINC
jgi:hypothetical protein